MIVTGQDVQLYYHDVDTDTDIVFACARSCTMNINPNFKNVTDYASAWYQKVKRDLTTWGVNIEGLLTLENYSYLFLSNLEASRETILIKFVVDNGAGGLVIYSGLVYPGPMGFTANNNEIGTYSVQLIGTGPYSSTGTQVTPTGILVEGGSVARFEYTVPVDGTSITVPGLIGASVITIFARGTAGEPTIIYAGTPAGDEIKFTTSTGSFTSGNDTPFLAGEKIWGNYK